MKLSSSHFSAARLFAVASLSACFAATANAAGAVSVAGASDALAFPRPLDSYGAVAEGAGVIDVLSQRIQAEPFNLVATIIFVLAIVHTFLTAKFRHLAHEVEHEHAKTHREGDVSFKANVLHFFGEVEVVFGLWVVVLMGAITWFKGWATVIDYVGHHVNFTEAMFVVVIMAVASTRPVLRFAEQCLRAVASLGKGSVGAWWLAILVIAPLLGSFITEPAAMTIGALLLAQQFYELKPSAKFAYATIGLLFVNISVGGTLTHFAAPPVLMVAGPWKWDTAYMFTHFGWKAAIGIVVATGVYYAIFRKELAQLETRRVSAAGAAKDVKPSESDASGESEKTNNRNVPVWITVVQLVFLAGVVYFAHQPALFIGLFLFFLGFMQATAHHQNRNLDLKPPLLVGFFLAGLVVHGGLQGWWIEPVLKSLGELPLFLSATALTAVNDNAAITYLATLVPGFTDALKYAVVAGAVTGGGLTVIANAPNPAGQSILQRYFPGGVSPLGLLVAALMPTVILAVCFLVF